MLIEVHPSRTIPDLDPAAALARRENLATEPRGGGIVSTFEYLRCRNVKCRVEKIAPV
jgi:hypothetical protein